MFGVGGVDGVCGGGGVCGCGVGGLILVAVVTLILRYHDSRSN